MDTVSYTHLEPYIHAAILAGDSSGQIMLRHILPNMLGPVLVTAMLDIGTMTVSYTHLDVYKRQVTDSG